MSRSYEERDTNETGDDNESGLPWYFGKPVVDEKFKEGMMCAVKMRGLPWKASFEDITEFFKDHSIVEKSIAFGRTPDDRKSG